MKRYKLYMFCSLATCIDLNSLNSKRIDNDFETCFKYYPFERNWQGR